MCNYKAVGKCFSTECFVEILLVCLFLGCFGKDQVYLDGILKILRYREKINFSLLTALGKVIFNRLDFKTEFTFLSFLMFFLRQKYLLVYV